MAKPVTIFIDRRELIGYTSLNLRRSKNEMTGEASISVFMGWMPTEPVFQEATKGKELLIYIGGHLAFTGFIDRRGDVANKSSRARDSEGRFVSGGGGESGGEGNLSIGPDEYTVSFTARGKTKYLIDSSQQHETGTMLRPTNKAAFEKLVEPWQTELDWQAADTQLDKVRFRDGGAVSDELYRIAQQTSLYLFETRDGKLRVTDGATAETGEPIVLGTNILQFSTDQAEDTSRSEIKVKGQRIEKDQWGNEAVIPTVARVTDAWTEAFIPLTVQQYGNATDDLLQKRAQYEANKRSSISKTVVVDMFHVQQTTGAPWDLGVMHYVEIPPANVFDVMEVTELQYIIEPDKTLKTKVTLSPAPVSMATGGGGFLADVPAVSNIASVAVGRKAKYGVSGTGLNWSGPTLALADVVNTVLTVVAPAFMGGIAEKAAVPPLELPASFKSKDTA